MIDDDPDIRTLLEIALERGGHAVVLAPSGTAGLEALRAADRAPPVVVLDVQMPDIDGFHVHEQIRADPSLQDTAVILCTVQVDHRDIGWANGCDAYLTKPFDIDELEAEISRLAALSGEALRTQRRERRLAR